MPTSISQFARPLVNEGLISEDWRNNEDELALVREFAEFSKRLPSSIKRHERVARFAKLKGITPTHSPKTPKLYDLYGTNLYSYAKLLVSAGLISQGWKRNPNDLETIHKFFQFLKSVDVNLSQEEKVQAFASTSKSKFKLTFINPMTGQEKPQEQDILSALYLTTLLPADLAGVLAQLIYHSAGHDIHLPNSPEIDRLRQSISQLAESVHALNPLTNRLDFKRLVILSNTMMHHS